MSVLQPFPRPVGDIGLGAFSAEGPVVTVQDLLELDVRVTWDEAVSIIEELCVAAQGLVMRPIPAARDIFVNSNGTVGIRLSASGVADPVEAARRLHELLGGSAAPAPLRLFISQAVSSGSYSTLAEFDDALAYFAKPGRQERVKAVYQRASERVTSRPEAADGPTPSPSPSPAPGVPWRPSSAALLQLWHRLQRAIALIGLAAGAATILLGLGMYFRPSDAPPSAASPPASTASAGRAEPRAPAGAEAADPADVARSSERPSTVRPSSALDAAQMPLTGSAAAIRYTGVAAVPGGPRPGAPTPAPAVNALPSTTAPADVSVRAPADGRQVQPQAPQTGAGAAAIVTTPFPPTPTATPTPTTIYSASDTTVQPAVLTRQQLLPPAFGGGVGRPIRMELIISPAGTVERARFLEAPQRMADMMLLSSAKTWQFTPAMKDGQPVRYRTVLSWVGAP